MKILYLFFFLLVFFGCHKEKIELEKQNRNLDAVASAETGSNNTSMAKKFSIKVKRVLPHDSKSFTQGLVFHEGYLYESTGQYGKSALYQIDPTKGKILKKIKVASEYFGEGITIFNKKIYMLTWQSSVCLVFDLNSFELIEQINYQGEGWGLTNYDENYLVQSDGTNVLKIINPNGFEIVNTIFVYDDDKIVSNLNELELIEGDIWANIWLSDVIAVIYRFSGKVKFWVDLSPLRKYVEKDENVDVLNGIAYDPRSKEIYLTGKYWKYIFIVELVE